MTKARDIASMLSSSQTLTNKTLTSPTIGNLSNVTGTLPVGVTGGSGLDVVNSGVTVADQWVLSVQLDTHGGSDDIVSNWIRPSDTPVKNSSTDYSKGWSGKGTGLTQSSGIFTFPVTGLYLIYLNVILWEDGGNSDPNAGVTLKVSVNNGNDYFKTIICRTHHLQDQYYTQASQMHLINANNIAYSGTDGVKFKITQDSNREDNYIYGDTSTINTGFTILRIGNAQ